MKAMKKWMAWLFVFVFLVSAIGCSGGGENSSTAGDTSAVSDSDTGGQFSRRKSGGGQRRKQLGVGSGGGNHIDLFL